MALDVQTGKLTAVPFLIAVELRGSWSGWDNVIRFPLEIREVSHSFRSARKGNLNSCEPKVHLADSELF